MTRRAGESASLLRTATLIVAVSVITFILDHLGAFDRFQTTGLDAFNVFHAPKDPTDVVLIGIHDSDYQDKNLFNATSPLNCESVKRVITAIAAGRPRAIGVDLDTSSPGFSCLAADDTWPPIVWVQDALWDPASNTFTPIPVLGGVAGLARPRDAMGIGAMPQESDGIIRRYHRELKLTNGPMQDTFPWAVIKAACAAKCDACCAATRDANPTEPLRLNFAGERFNFRPLSVKNVLDITATEESKAGWRERGPLVGKIVLLGGDYRAARDTYVTPVGSMNGVQIMAQAIESELQGGGIRPIQEWLMVVIDLSLGVLMAWIHFRLRDRVTWAFAISFVLIPFLCLVASYVTFSTLGLWFNFFTVPASVVIHQLYERAREGQKTAA